MADRNPRYHAGIVTMSSSSNLRDFAEYVEKQAKGMEQFGWKEVHGLHQWVQELRRKARYERVSLE